MSPDPRWKWFRQPGIAATILLGSGTPALADDPAFDRPGIAFYPALCRHARGLGSRGCPISSSDRVDGVTEDAYLANTRLRFGVTDRFEVQVAVPLFLEVHSQGSGRAFRESGTGDFSVAAKLALGRGDAPVEMAVLARCRFRLQRGANSAVTPSCIRSAPRWPMRWATRRRSPCTRTSTCSTARRPGRCRRTGVSHLATQSAAMSRQVFSPPPTGRPRATLPAADSHGWYDRPCSSMCISCRD